MKNQISGDFDSQTLEEFRSLYAQREIKPEDLEVDQYTGLPTDVITNVSPWIEHTGLWRANPGTERDFVPNQVLSAGEEYEDEEGYDDLSKEDYDSLLESVISEIEDEEAFANAIYNSDDDDEDAYRGETSGDEMSDDELDSLINSILEENREEEEERKMLEEASLEPDTEIMSDEDLDNLINELLSDTSEEEEVGEEEEEDELADSDIEAMIRSIMEDEDNYDEPDSEVTEDSGDEEEMSEDEVDSLIDQIMSDLDED